jgi:hypothetical protein
MSWHRGFCFFGAQKERQVIPMTNKEKEVRKLMRQAEKAMYALLDYVDDKTPIQYGMTLGDNVQGWFANVADEMPAEVEEELEIRMMAKAN